MNARYRTYQVIAKEWHLVAEDTLPGVAKVNAKQAFHRLRRTISFYVLDTTTGNVIARYDQEP